VKTDCHLLAGGERGRKASRKVESRPVLIDGKTGSLNSKEGAFSGKREAFPMNPRRGKAMALLAYSRSRWRREQKKNS